MNANVRTAIVWTVLFCLAALLFVVVKSSGGRPTQELSFTKFIDMVNSDRVKSVVVTGNEVSGQFKDDKTDLHTTVPLNYPRVFDVLGEHNVDVKVKESSNGNWTALLLNAIPFVLVIAFWIFMMRQMQSGGNKALSFGKSRARLHS